MTDTRTCTCHPDDNPTVPCARQYAFAECVAAAKNQENQMTEPKVVRRNPRFNDKDYIRATRLDRWAALTIGIAVLIVVALDSAWLMGWLK